MKIAVCASDSFGSGSQFITEANAFMKDIDDGGEAGVKLYFPNKHTRLKEILRNAFRTHGWYRYPIVGPAAEARRKLLDSADNVLIFWDGQSAGTKKLIDVAEKEGKNFRLVMI